MKNGSLEILTEHYATTANTALYTIEDELPMQTGDTLTISAAGNTGSATPLSSAFTTNANKLFIQKVG